MTDMTELSARIRSRREELGISQEELAHRLGYSTKSSISKIETGANDVPRSKLEEFAQALDTTVSYLMGLPAEFSAASERPFSAVPIPLIGSIACGTPILAEENIERYIGVDIGCKADFALVCHGDSMLPDIRDGDVVFIHSQPVVEQGEVAAVRIGDEATLKHFHRQGDTVMLLADNTAVCPPMIFTGKQLEDIKIEGKAVGVWHWM